MYQSNPAVIKSILSRLPKHQFILHARYIRRQAFKLPAGNRKRMFVLLFRWCGVHYRRRWR